MGIRVMKFGGSSVADVDRIRLVARQVMDVRRAGHDVVVVVSAMGKTTDGLLAQAHAVSPNPDRRELDMLLSVGERISMALLCMAIKDLGGQAVSLTGSQAGIITNDRHSDARILEMRAFRVEDELARGSIVIVAGYQGVSYRKEVTTLGRGGSDTTAVALAAALGAERCDIFSDVDGVYTTDPRVVPEATRLAALGHAEMQELAESGAKVLNAQAVEWARKAGIRIHARKTGSADEGTVVDTQAPPPSHGVRAVAQRARVLWLEALGVDVDALLSLLADHHAPTDQLWMLDGGSRVCAALPLENLHGQDVFRDRVNSAFGGAVSVDQDSGMVSLVGDGLSATPAVLVRSLGVLRQQGVTARHVFTGPLRLGMVVPAAQVNAVVAGLHRAFLE